MPRRWAFHEESEGSPRLRLAGFGVVELDHFADFAEGKAEPLAPQDELEAGAVARRIDPLLALALRAQEPLVLVEPDRPGGDIELLGEIGDGKGLCHGPFLV